MRRLLCLALLALTACETDPREETTLFELAEASYRAGQYDAAVKRYEEFLQAWPRSPLAQTAQLRLRTIDREINSVMGAASGGNQPVYAAPRDLPTQEPAPKPTQEPAQEPAP